MTSQKKCRILAQRHILTDLRVSPESAVDFSGGGFSNYFARPSYQDAAVEAWLAGNNNPDLQNLVNKSGRAFPDVSAQGSDFHVFIAGTDSLVGGTSASTPAFSSIINLVSNQLLVEGKAPLGFLNPFLYSSGTAGLTDIVNGNSEGCSNLDGGVGFSAVEGWDPVTGLGTPVFDALLTAAGGSWTPKSCCGIFPSTPGITLRLFQASRLQNYTSPESFVHFKTGAFECLHRCPITAEILEKPCAL